MTLPDLDRKTRQLDNVVHAIYDMLKKIKEDHGELLDRILQEQSAVRATLQRMLEQMPMIDSWVDDVLAGARGLVGYPVLALGWAHGGAHRHRQREERYGVAPPAA